MKFRQDINGLRAFAVIAVVLFHFNSTWLPGGFAGVDVFFVISGFLMTGIIFKGIENNNFSILNFYVARANRIIPALALLCMTLLIFGWFYLTPLEYKALGKHAAGSIGFLSNILYMREAGYFDAASHEKWLLHTWSLSVEWQFYIIYPVLLVGLRKIVSLQSLKIILLIGTLVGFTYSAIATYQSPNASYYLLPMRAWEMMLGGIAFLYPFKLADKRKRLTEWTGLALIVSSYFLISESAFWPGYLALFPVFGSFLIIQAQRSDSILTSNILFQKLGAWSYSIYLWHWPLVVAIYTFSLPDYYIYIGLLLSVLLGFLSYKYIERIKFKRDYINLLSYLKCKPIYIACLVGILSSTIFLIYDFLSPMRLSSEQTQIVEQMNRNPREAVCGKVVDGVLPGCVYGSGPVKAIVVGDSHAQAQVATIGEVAARNGGSIIDYGLSACTTIKGLFSVESNGNNLNRNCGKLVENVIEVAATEYPDIPIIVINRTSQNLYGENEKENSLLSRPTKFIDQIFSERNEQYRANLMTHMVNTICEFTEHNPVYLMRPTPELIKDVPLTMFRTLTLSGVAKKIKIPLSEYYERQLEAYQMQDQAVNECGAKLLDPIPYLCDSNYCYGDEEGVPLYFDDNHLSKYGSEYVSPMYNDVFK